jgi:hypothetical protein
MTQISDIKNKIDLVYSRRYEHGKLVAELHKKKKMIEQALYHIEFDRQTDLSINDDYKLLSDIDKKETIRYMNEEENKYIKKLRSEIE